MEIERWRKAKELFDAALDLEPARQEGYLDDVCGEDRALREEVEALLSAHREADCFLERPAPPPRRGVSGAETIGPYRVIRELGHGGMGDVYLAQRADGSFERKVAVKVVRPEMASFEIVQRFCNERQILADLEHPNIARLLDGGSLPDGTPYLVMEYVAGEPIDRFCLRSGFSTRERLELFLEVCSAVAFAHRKRVLHRDLKPGNILVTPHGVAKLLDFGIAKLLEKPSRTRPGLTRLGQRPMTPEYASPEQIRGEAIGTASDVYALGVVCYELLTGRRPYRLRGDSRTELEEAICVQAPEKPSTVERLLGTGLDDVVLKALSKEPRRRYGSVEGFSDDLRRCLSGLPVRAGGPVYRASSFVKRHAVGVAIGGLAALAMARAAAHRRLTDSEP